MGDVKNLRMLKMTFWNLMAHLQLSEGIPTRLVVKIIFGGVYVLSASRFVEFMSVRRRRA